MYRSTITRNTPSNAGQYVASRIGSSIPATWHSHAIAAKKPLQEL
jgi:hypothetical protein